MATPLAIDKMTIEEKLQALEPLWDDLCQHEEAVPVQQWQKDILDRREQLIEEGKAHFIDWEQAQKDIARETSWRL
jgi:putative addiction module component (TIGR02574 family)